MNCRKLCCRTIRLGMIFLTVVVVALAFTIVNETHEARKKQQSPKHYIQLINERCNSNFSIANVTFGDNCFWGFQDIGYEFKCDLIDGQEVNESRLLQSGWHYSIFPEELVEQGVLGKTAFTSEMVRANSSCLSYWKYADMASDQERASDEGTVYRSSHYMIALYLPDEDLLYYLEESI